MFSWNYQEAIYKDIMIDHAKDLGRLYCETILQYPKLYSDFIAGFMEALQNKTQGK